jgi:hypothetical protein
MARINIHWLGGICPVQGDGTIEGASFAFRARGERWSVTIENHYNRATNTWGWSYGEPYKVGTKYAAGWMNRRRAKRCIRKAAEKWMKEKRGK